MNFIFSPVKERANSCTYRLLGLSAGVFQHDKAMHINLYAPNKSKSNENDGENKLL
jgi:hypothetical protein